MNVEWPDYYAAIAGRHPRDLFVRALAMYQGSPGNAVDAGFGDGTETAALLAAGWFVFAVDPEPDAARRLRSRIAGDTDAEARLTAATARLEEVPLPRANFIYAGLSLPFLDNAAFGRAWASIRGALAPGGVIAAHLFGWKDTWATNVSMSFHDRASITVLIDGLDLLDLHEIDEDGRAVSGPKHWHTYELVARQPIGDNRRGGL